MIRIVDLIREPLSICLSFALMNFKLRSHEYDITKSRWWHILSWHTRNRINVCSYGTDIITSWQMLLVNVFNTVLMHCN